LLHRSLDVPFHPFPFSFSIFHAHRPDQECFPLVEIRRTLEK
jgi:hypothetical protein